ncbi:MAG: enoyl-CoA hydratase-related protein [Desulfobacteraceae bacterium]
MDTPSKPLVTYHREEKVGLLTLNRPEKRNAMNLNLWTALDEAIAQAEEDESARVFLLRGEGKSFCAGLDLGPDNDIIQAINAPQGASQKVKFFNLVKKVQAIHTRLERLIKPTIAVIHGHCLGAGLELILCCDFRICSRETLLGLPEATLGIITDVGGLQRLPRVVGPGHAREIAFRGHQFDAERAKEINLVNWVYPDTAALEGAAMEMAREIADNPPLAVQGAKEVFLFDEGSTLEESLEYNAARSSMILPSEDLFEVMAARIENRKGNYKGA